VQESVITRHGLARLNDELERLTTEGRSAASTRLAEAAARGADRLADADYLDAIDDRDDLERRIAVLESRLRAAEVVEPLPGNGRADVGEWLRLRDLASGDVLEIQLVGRFEADASAGRISVAAPLGQAVLGTRAGEIVEVDAPIGPTRYEVLAIEAPEPCVQGSG
jgi:transcription elongation factor GreA